MVGRPHHNFWKKLHFGMVRKAGGRLVAICLLCNRELLNTARSRLLLHRKNCLPVNEHGSSSEMNKIISETMSELRAEKGHQRSYASTAGTSSREVRLLDEDMKSINDETEDTKPGFEVYFDPTANEFIISTNASNDDSGIAPINDIVEAVVVPQSDNTFSPSRKALPKKLSKEHPVSSQTPSSDANLEDINLAFSEFFISSRIPLKTLRSKYLKAFLEKLNKSYNPPNLLELTTTYVEKICEKYKPHITEDEQDAILLLTGWNTLVNPSKCIVACLYIKAQNESAGCRLFLNLWDLEAEMVGAEEEMQIKIIQEAKGLAKDLYNANVYAIISDNPQLNIDSFNEPLWHFVCHSYLGGCLADCVVNEDDTKLVTQLLLPFQRQEMEKEILEEGGTRVLLPSDKTWCTYRDSFKSFIDNHKLIRELVSKGKCKVHHNYIEYIFSDEFLDRIKTYHTVLVPLCNLIYSSQKKTANLAEITEEWLRLSFPPVYEDHLERKRNEALTPFAMAANFFHPIYRGRRLNGEQKIMIEYFLVESLDATGLDQLILFKRNDGIFKMLAAKKLKSYDTFWSIAEQICPELAALAKKLLCIPASISYFDKTFTDWSTTHSATRNLLGMNRYKNLTKAYFTLNLCHN